MTGKIEIIFENNISDDKIEEMLDWIEDNISSEYVAFYCDENHFRDITKKHISDISNILGGE